eukprot:2367595-Pleurochrysis_carterae.AAC.1
MANVTVVNRNGVRSIICRVYKLEKRHMCKIEMKFLARSSPPESRQTSHALPASRERRRAWSRRLLPRSIRPSTHVTMSKQFTQALLLRMRLALSTADEDLKSGNSFNKKLLWPCSFWTAARARPTR